LLPAACTHQPRAVLAVLGTWSFTAQHARGLILIWAATMEVAEGAPSRIEADRSCQL